ncbi:MAG: hypothetical protein QM503_07605, partial [Bacteroidota bacterium]
MKYFIRYVFFFTIFISTNLVAASTVLANNTFSNSKDGWAGASVPEKKNKLKITTITVSPAADDICYGNFTKEGINLLGVGVFNKTRMPVKNLNSNTLTDVQVALGTSSLFSAFGNCGVEDGSGTCEDANGASFMMFSAFNDGVSFDLEDLSQNEGITPYTESLFSFLNDNNYDLVASYKKNGILHQGKMKPCPISYCETNDLGEGFHVVDPDNGNKDNSFELFCHEDTQNIWHDLIALPIKNNSNNFVFNNKNTSLNYYDTTANPRTDFHAIEIDGGHITYNGTTPTIPVIKARSTEPWNITTDEKAYKVLGSTFSNINLIGTPFTIDWNNSELQDCNTSKLRKAFKQAVKYNTLVADGESRCKIKTLNLSLLDDYKFLVYNNEEVLQHSCKEMASYIPNNVGVLNDSDINGHFNILTSEPAYPNETPTTNGTRNNSTDLGAKGAHRPITVYCKYQTDLHYVWTFLTALDGVVTNSKTDITEGKDTCSQLGLYFFTPNTKETFNRVRKYLKTHKDGDNGWINYTGTVREKYKMYRHNSSQEYYLSNIGYEHIWPYGPLGIYFPFGGDFDKDDVRNDWGGNQIYVKGYMSGSPMHNISTMSNYNDSMGHKGFVSILGSQDLNKTNDWWVADIGAGEEIGNCNSQKVASYSPHGKHLCQPDNEVYYEPNGNYAANAWLNFIQDDEGWTYHNDDNSAFYAYYDYMCMADTNYDRTSRYTLVPGFFDAIERDRNQGESFSDKNLTTQIVEKNIAFDILLYKINSTNGQVNKTELETAQNRSVGVFLSQIVDPNPPVPIKYLGEFNNFSDHNGRIPIQDFNETSAVRRAEIQFYYCQNQDTNWTDCWNFTKNQNPITLSSKTADAKSSDSIDDFAIRPKYFKIVSPNANNVIKAEDVNITYYAYDEQNKASVGYNEPFNNLEFNTSLADVSKINKCQNKSLGISADTFTDGELNASKFANVGIWRVQLKEKDGYEFAKVDRDDNINNAQNAIQITPAYINLTILPSYFKVDIPATIDWGNNFTYLSNDLNGSAIKFDINITAKNSDKETTQNYSNHCYANSINFSTSYVIPGTTPSQITHINYTELNSSTISTTPVIDGNFSLSLPALLFSTLSKGEAKIHVRANFNRENNISVNPFKVNFQTLHLKDITYSPTITENNNSNIDLNATMLYGRTHAPRQTFEGPDGNVSMYYEVYCSGAACNKALLQDGTDSNTTDDPRWFINTKHSDEAGTAAESATLQKAAANVSITRESNGNHPDYI